MAGQVSLGPLHHYRLTVTDVERSTRFYRDVLGFELVLDGPPPPDHPEHDLMTESLQGGVGQRLTLEQPHHAGVGGGLLGGAAASADAGSGHGRGSITATNPAIWFSAPATRKETQPRCPRP